MDVSHLELIQLIQDILIKVNFYHLYFTGIFLEFNKANGKKLLHIWDVIQYFYEWSKALELRDVAVGRLSEAFKLDSIDGRTATSKQVNHYLKEISKGTISNKFLFFFEL